MAKAKEREKEQDILYERKLSKEREKEDHLYGDKDKFVTRAYKEKLAEEAKWLAEEKRLEAKEEANDVRAAFSCSFYVPSGICCFVKQMVSLIMADEWVLMCTYSHHCCLLSPSTFICQIDVTFSHILITFPGLVCGVL